MNVENRKLFANRDARRRLAEMGGIMASSPELLGEAQLYGLGGDVSVEEYVAVIPGINSGRPIRLKMETLARLQELAPELMQQAFVMDQATAEQRGVDVMRLRPGDAFVERQVIEASPMLQARGVQTAPMQAPGMDVSPGYMSAPDSFVPNTGVIPIGDFPLQEPGLDAASFTVQPSQVPMNAMEELYASGAMDDTLSSVPPVAPEAASASLPSEELLAPVAPPKTGDRSDLLYVNVPGVTSSPVLMTEENFNLLEEQYPQALQSTDVTVQDVGSLPDNLPFNVEDLQIVDTLPLRPLEVKQASDASAEAEIAQRSLERVQEEGTVPGTDIPTSSAAKTKIEQQQAAVDAATAASAAARKAEVLGATPQEIADAERKQMEGIAPAELPEEAIQLAKDSPDLTTQIEEVVKNPDKTPAEKNKEAATAVLGAAGLVDPAKPLSSKEAVSAYEKMFKEMLGEDDEDKAKEMWHNMAMIGFAIASGESPRALQNIANGLLAGTKMMKEDRAAERKREDTITMLAIEAAQEDKSAAEKFQRDLALVKARDSGTSIYEKMPTLTEAIDDAAKAEMTAAAAIGKSISYADAVTKVSPIVKRLYGKGGTDEEQGTNSNRDAIGNSLGL
jgi:hypothetical protein